MIKFDVPRDNNILKELEDWRKSINFADALLGSESINNDTYEKHEDKSSILSLLTEEYLNETIIPSENKHDIGQVNNINLGHNSLHHQKISANFHMNLQIEGLEFDRISGAFWYPPTGFMGWHSNADHEAYRMYAAWAEEGHKSFFRYRDPNTKKIVTSWDKKGWNFRLFNCSQEDKPWHCVYSDTNRISLGFWYNGILATA